MTSTMITAFSRHPLIATLVALVAAAVAIFVILSVLLLTGHVVHHSGIH